LAVAFFVKDNNNGKNKILSISSQHLQQQDKQKRYGKFPKFCKIVLQSARNSISATPVY
jgi:hypothetical protein